MGALIGRVVRAGCIVTDPLLPQPLQVLLCIHVLVEWVQADSSAAKDVWITSTTRWMVGHAPDTWTPPERAPLDPTLPAVLLETVYYPLVFPSTLSRMGLKPPHAVLLAGPPGVGKTRSVQILALMASARLV